MHRPRHATAILVLICCGSLLLTGCSRPPAPSVAGEDAALTAGLYIDWDELDFHLDRYLQINLKDYVTTQGLGPRDPAAAYRQAVAYDAPWDSVGLAFFLRLNDDEQNERRQLAAKHHDQARRLVLATVHHHRNMILRGQLPNLNSSDMANRPQGVETAVTGAIKHLVRATGLDPSRAAAWRDLAYFLGTVGDRARQERALSAALAALDKIDPGQAAAGDPGRLRRDLLLDLAWLSRDQNQPSLTIAYLDHAQPWLATEAPEGADRLYEARLLRGLALADLGRWQEAGEVARQLPARDLHVRVLRGGVREDLRWHLSAPNREQLGYDRHAWPRRASDFGKRWVMAQSGAPSGDLRHTIYLLGAPPTDLELPARLASRYWQDRGRLHALAGEQANAARCYQWAAFYRPYLAFFPLQANGRQFLLGEYSALQQYYTGYGIFFVCGDRSSFQQDLVAALVTSP